MVHAFMVLCADEHQSSNIHNITPGLLWWHCYTPEWNLPRRYAYRLVTLVAQRVYSDLRLQDACNRSFLQSGRVGPPSGASGSSAATASSGQGSSSSSSSSNAQGQGNVPRLPPLEGVLRFAVPSQEALQEMVLSLGDDDSDANDGDSVSAGTISNTTAELPAVSKASVVVQQQSPPIVLQTPGGTAHRAVRVIWRSVPQFVAAAALVLQEGESLALAQHVLATTCKALCEQTSAGSGSSSGSGGPSSSPSSSRKSVAALRKELFETRSDETAVVLDHFLPSGELVVINGSYYKHLKKEAEALISSK